MIVKDALNDVDEKRMFFISADVFGSCKHQ